MEGASIDTVADSQAALKTQKVYKYNSIFGMPEQPQTTNS